MLQQVKIVVARPVAHLAAQPRRTRKFFRYRAQFEFRHDQTCIVAEKLVDFEHYAGTRYIVADFLDHGRAKLLEHAFGIGERDCVFVLASLDPGNRRLDIEPGRLAGGSHANGTAGAWAVGQRPLPAIRGLRGTCAPARRPLPAVHGLRGTCAPARRPLPAIHALRGTWAPARRQVTLNEPLGALHMFPPLIANDQKFAFDFYGHEWVNDRIPQPT